MEMAQQELIAHPLQRQGQQKEALLYKGVLLTRSRIANKLQGVLSRGLAIPKVQSLCVKTDKHAEVNCKRV